MATAEDNMAFKSDTDDEMMRARGDILDAMPEEKQPEEKQPEEKQPEEKQPEEKQPEEKQPEEKEPEGEEDIHGEKPTAQGSEYVHASRFNKVYAQRKAAEEENERLRAELEALKAGRASAPAAPATATPTTATPTTATPTPDGPPELVDLDNLEAQAAEAVLQGDIETYRELRKQIREAERDALRRQLHEEDARVRQEEAAAQEKTRLAETAAKAVDKYPFLDPETGNPEAIKRVIIYRNGLIAEGMAPHAALAEAVEAIAPAYVESAAPEAKPDAKDQRKEAAVRRNVEAANSTPPDTGTTGVGNRATVSKINVENLTSKQFKEIPEEELARLRGDVL